MDYMLRGTRIMLSQSILQSGLGVNIMMLHHLY